MKAARNRPVRVVHVDDSLVCRNMARKLLEPGDGIEIVGQAEHPYAALELLQGLERPDVILLDLEMPLMNGLTFLKLLMRTARIPVVVFSSFTQPNSAALIEALAHGAVDVLCKPAHPAEYAFTAGRLREALQIAASSAPDAPTRQQTGTQGAAPATPGRDHGPERVDVIGIGASTGGPQAFQRILPGLRPDGPPIVLAQHMPPGLMPAFVHWLGKLAPCPVEAARDRVPLVAGTIHVAAGPRHLCVERDAGRLVTHLSSTPLGGLHRPSIDVMFDSVARAAGAYAVGVILTGMGRDGAAGLLAMRQAGGYTLAEHASTCVVNGMPLEAVRLGAAREETPLDRIPDRISTLVHGDPCHART